MIEIKTLRINLFILLLWISALILALSFSSCSIVHKVSHTDHLVTDSEARVITDTSREIHSTDIKTISTLKNVDVEIDFDTSYSNKAPEHSDPPINPNEFLTWITSDAVSNSFKELKPLRIKFHIDSAGTVKTVAKASDDQQSHQVATVTLHKDETVKDKTVSRIRIPFLIIVGSIILFILLLVYLVYKFKSKIPLIKNL